METFQNRLHLCFINHNYLVSPLSEMIFHEMFELFMRKLTHSLTIQRENLFVTLLGLPFITIECIDIQNLSLNLVNDLHYVRFLQILLLLSSESLMQFHQ